MSQSGPCEPGFVDEAHDHDRCIRQALDRAARLCRDRGVRLTPQRRRVLELVWQTHRPVGAYDILHQLRQEMRAEPPTVYRALDFLQQQGLVHRLATVNAYIGCSTPDTPHAAVVLICQQCKGLQPLATTDLVPAIHREARQHQFTVGQEIVEILGTCATCRKERP